MSLIKLGCFCFTLLFSYHVFNWIVYGESIWNFFLLFTSLAHILLYSLYFIDPVKTVN